MRSKQLSGCLNAQRRQDHRWPSVTRLLPDPSCRPLFTSHTRVSAVCGPARTVVWQLELALTGQSRRADSALNAANDAYWAASWSAGYGTRSVVLVILLSDGSH